MPNPPAVKPGAARRVRAGEPADRSASEAEEAAGSASTSASGRASAGPIAGGTAGPACGRRAGPTAGGNTDPTLGGTTSRRVFGNLRDSVLNGSASSIRTLIMQTSAHGSWPAPERMVSPRRRNRISAIHSMTHRPHPGQVRPTDREARQTAQPARPQCGHRAEGRLGSPQERESGGPFDRRERGRRGQVEVEVDVEVEIRAKVSVPAQATARPRGLPSQLPVQPPQAFRDT
jgi:hypothetical protein